VANFLKVFKVNALPATLEPSSLYLIPSSVPAILDIHVSDSTGTATRHVLNKTDIEALITAGVAGLSTTLVVDDIAARNALVLDENGIVLVIDATGDTSVVSGAATYVYRKSDTSWTKISEAESMDVALNWANIQDKPTSSVGAIDQAVTDSHTHANKASIDRLTVDNGVLSLDGSPVRPYLEIEEW